jgi:hypothetical protein
MRRRKNMNNRSFVIAFALIVLLASAASAIDYGGYAGAYLQLSVQPRATGMGNAYTAVADDASGLFFNPAAASQIKRFTFGGAYRVLSMDRSLQELAVVFPVRGEAAIGFSAELASMSGIEGRDRIGNPTGELSNLDAVFSVTFARRFSKLISIGGNARYYHKKLESTTAYSAGFDVGGMLFLAKDDILPDNIPVDLLRFAFVIQNMAAKYPWKTGDYWQDQGLLGSDVTENVPVSVVVGASGLMLDSRLLLALDGEVTQHKSVKINSGVEYRPVYHAALRTGLAEGRPTFGLGLFTHLGKIEMEVDVAVEKSQNLDDWETIVGSSWKF